MKKRVSRSLIAFLLVIVFGGSLYAQEERQRFSRPGVSADEAASVQPRKTGVHARVSGDLVALQQEYDAYLRRPESRRADPFTPSIRMMPVRGGYVVVDATAVGDPEALQNQMLSLGAVDVSHYGRYVSGRVPIGMLDSLAKLSQLRFARPFYAETRIGATTSQGDVAQASDVVRDVGLPPAYTGAGVDVGVMSDSYDCGNPSLLTNAADDIASGDLPAGGVTVLLEEPGCGSASDEGRAMLQIVHDVAPGAGLLFHSAFGGIASFANGIGALVTAGADVVVDDVFYYAEPMFQDGPIAQAADAAFAAGVPYFSSAGNSASQSYEMFFSVSGFLGPSGFDTHDFDPGPGIDDLQAITVPVGAGVNLVLQWLQPYGNAETDLDIFIVAADESTILAVGGDPNIGGDPLEIVTFNNVGFYDYDGVPGPDTTFNILIENFAGPTPELIKYALFGSGPSIDEYDTVSGTSYGHSSAVGAAAVGAAWYGDTPAFGQTPPLAEDFTSSANVPILFDTDGTEFPVPFFRPKPDFTGPDGGNTTFFGQDVVAPSDPDTFPNFFGTSASAPHVAAGAALLLEADPTLTPTDIYGVLADSAIDMETPGFDVDTGAGLVQIDAAEAAIANGAPTLEPITTQEGVTGNVLNFTLDATVTADPEGDNLSFTQTGMPEPACALTDNGNGTGQISCTLTANDIGLYPVAVTVTDDGTPPRSDTQGFYVIANINDSPEINQVASPQNMNDGDPPLNIDFAATDSNPGDTLSFTQFGMPPFCTFNTANPNGPDTAQMTCDPGYNNTGAYIITVKVSDDAVPVRGAAQTFVLAIANVNRDPVLDPIGPQSVDEGAQIVINGSATDPDVPDALVLTANEPDFCVGVDNGDGTGTLTCNPGFDDAGVYNITVTVTDSFGGSDFETFALTVNDANQPPVVNFVGNQVVANNEDLVIAVSATDPDGNAVQLSDVSGLPGFCISDYSAGATGTITCDPQGPGDNGTYTVTIRATDDGTPNLTDDEVFDIVVAEPGTQNVAPVLDPVGNQVTDNTRTLVIPLSATDADGDAMSFVNTSGLPGFCVLNDGNGTGNITCNATFMDVGVYPVTVRVTDDGTPNLTDSEAITITVNLVNALPVADAGPDQQIVTFETAFLDGSNSTDLETLPANLLFRWRFVGIPEDSTVTDQSIFDRFTDTPSFIADADGTYILELSVADEDGGVDVDTVSVVTDTPQTLWFSDGISPFVDIRDAMTGLSSSSTNPTGYPFWIGAAGGELVQDVPGIAVDPTTNMAYAAVRRNGQAASELVTFDPFSAVLTGNAVGTALGNMGDVVFGLDFAADGTLYAITADDGTPNVVTPETLFTVDITDGSMTQVQDLDDGGNVGEAIAFNTDTGTLYHASGTIFESVDIVGMTTTNIGFSGDMPAPGAYNIHGLAYDRDRDLLVGTRLDPAGGTFFSVTDAGVVADIGIYGSNRVWRDIAFWDLSFQVPTAVAASGDQSGDGNADILFRNSDDGQNALWEMTGGTRDANVGVAAVATNWNIVGDGDYNGDGFQDLLWRSSTGEMAIWLMQSGVRIANLALPTVAEAAWTVVGDGDYNADGVSDVLWRNTSTGANAIWQINNGRLTTNLGVLAAPNQDWVVIADGDFTGDGSADILWRNIVSGNVALWEMDGAAREFNRHVATVNLSWDVVGDGDMNGDGIADILWRNADGRNALWAMNGSNFTNLAVPLVSNTDWTVVGNRDYDGDGFADILWYHVVQGYVVFWGMNSGNRLSNVLIDTVNPLSNWDVLNLD